MILISKTSGSGRTHWTHSIYLEPVNPKTYANAVLLKNYYQRNDSDFLESFEGRMVRIAYSRATLSTWQTKLGSLFCVYCNKPDLIIELDEMKVSQDVKATLEHLNPISKGGDPFDLNHIVCACGKCNGQRSNKDLNTFVKGKKITQQEFLDNCQIYFDLNK